MDVLANWLWQGCAVTLAATVMLRSRRVSATMRYHLWWLTLAVVLVLPASSLQFSAFGPPHLDVATFQSASVAHAAGANSWTAAVGSFVLPALPWWTGGVVLAVWCVWAIGSLLRTLVALVTLRRTKRTARPFPDARERRLQTWLSLRTHGRRARLAVSDQVHAAAVLGLTSPSIAIAPRALLALDDEELDQVIVHEWAHVHRRDDIARLAQRFIVALAGLHPAVWWIDRQLQLERETACDDWAINMTGSARRLAVCLTKLASLPGRPTEPVLLPAAVLSSTLTTRVVRLLDAGRNTSTTRKFGAPMLVVPVLGALALTVGSIELVVTAPLVLDAPRAVRSEVTDSEPAAARDARTHLSAEPAALAPVPTPSRPLRESTVAAMSPRIRTGVSPALLPQGQVPVVPAAFIDPVTPRGQDRQAAPVPAARAVEDRRLRAEELPGTTTAVPGEIAPAALDQAQAPAAHDPQKSPTLWGAAADAGVTVGKGSQKAAVATAGFFTRLSKSISGVF